MSKRSQILSWVERGFIPREKARAALSAVGVLPDLRRWRVFIESLLIWLGGTALALALMFFIAYNWDSMGRFGKFSLIEVSLLLSLVVYWKLAPDSLAGRVSLLVSSLLVGVLLAFYGQTYQTGADTWELFWNWALLMLPWVLISRFVVQWLLWIALLNLAIVLYFQVRPGLFGFALSSFEDRLWLLFCFNSIVWLIWEYSSKRFTFLAQRWAVRLIAMASGSAITTLCIYSIFDGDTAVWPIVLVYFAWLGAVYYSYRLRIPDLFMLAGGCLSAIVVVLAFAGRQLLETNNAVGGFLLMTFLLAGLASVATIWLRNVHREFES